MFGLIMQTSFAHMIQKISADHNCIFISKWHGKVCRIYSLSTCTYIIHPNDIIISDNASSLPCAPTHTHTHARINHKHKGTSQLSNYPFWVLLHSALMIINPYPVMRVAGRIYFLFFIFLSALPFPQSFPALSVSLIFFLSLMSACSHLSVYVGPLKGTGNSSGVSFPLHIHRWTPPSLFHSVTPSDPTPPGPVSPPLPAPLTLLQQWERWRDFWDNLIWFHLITSLPQLQIFKSPSHTGFKMVCVCEREKSEGVRFVCSEGGWT